MSSFEGRLDSIDGNLSHSSLDEEEEDSRIYFRGGGDPGNRLFYLGFAAAAAVAIVVAAVAFVAVATRVGEEMTNLLLLAVEVPERR